MPNFKILVTDSDTDVERYFAKTAADLSPSFLRGPLTEENAAEARDVDAICIDITTTLTASLMRELPKLKFICTRSTGYDHIDLQEAERRGITVSNVVGYGTLPVPEHVFALLLALVRKVREADRRVREGDFDYHGLMGVQVCGKTFGVLGTGAIGARVAEIALAMGARVLAYDVVKNSSLEAKGVSYASLEEVLKESDFISVNLPLLPSTRHLLNAERISLVKRGAFIVNTGRGGVVDEEELVRALREGRIAGAGLDVFEEEPPRGELLELDNVVLSPHVGWYTDAGFAEIMRQTVENVRAFAAGKPIRVVKSAR
ncbi:NAD(P)-dependent oxidoreductase [Thermoproteati archaeon 3817-70]